ncbi:MULTISPECIES: GntR family transcriptional regulator [unclassified Sphingomonas]|uniref:GntR family transcriptional regulator n=1 Tax=unclassified Sphingomonas TaxID=196159 RepID=UPI002151B1E5|nr:MULTISPECIES: GntR family transcriptional regulator [unclassified Sphingomonas]MCR5871270.1 GntR family transcriptional regulator [Sphingomonas sp. J344]UUY00424.1 GntR family transcriptional regulator [Sphingomonas sp. J315]
MNSGATAERVHEALKARIMGREFRPGDRLDPAILAVPLASSVTPVRDALHLLTGEDLVETRTGDGFHVPALDEPALKDLYDWSAELVALAIHAWPRPHAAIVFHPRAQDGHPIAERVAEAFLGIARRSPNGEHARAVDRLNARLHAVRTVEAHVLDNVDAELAAVTAAAEAGERNLLRRLNTAYHRRRRRAAAAIVRAVYRAD